MADKRVKTDAKKEIVQLITKMSGKYHPGIIFDDWVCCMAIAIQNSCFLIHNSLWNKREAQYINTLKKYDLEERLNFPVMFRLLTDAFEDNMTDILGGIYMESGAGNKGTGQFFTPFHISKLTGGIAIPADISEDKPFTLNEPSVGGGGMIIAAAAVLKERGINRGMPIDQVSTMLGHSSIETTTIYAVSAQEAVKANHKKYLN